MQGVRERKRIIEDKVKISGFANCAHGKTIHKDSEFEKTGFEVGVAD